MRARRCTRGIAAIALVLFAFAAVFAEPAAFAPAAVLALFLCYRAFVFSGAFGRLIRSVSVRRRAGRQIIRQGAAVDIETEIACEIPEGMRIEIRDLPPRGAVVTGGEAGGYYGIPGACRTLLSYRITAAARGDIGFAGLAVTASDAFFSDRLVLLGPEYEEPVLRIQPAGQFEAAPAPGTVGDLEAAKKAASTGHSVHSFREYAEGDDLRHVDWKLSAKYQKLFVREYAARMGEASLIVVDMPDRSSAADPSSLDRLVSSAGAAIEQVFQQHRAASLLIVSGGNLIRFLPDERDIRQLMLAVRYMQPAERLVHHHREPHEAELRARLYHAEKSVPLLPAEDRSFGRTLAAVYRQFLSDRQVSVFEAQVARVMASLSRKGADVFCTGTGDLTHIRTILHQAHLRRVAVRLHLPEEACTPGMLGRLLVTGSEGVEVIR